MAQTPPDITVTTSNWISMNVESGFNVGTAFSIINKSTEIILLSEGTKPAADSTDGALLLGLQTNYAHMSIPASSLEIWARSLNFDARVVAQGA